MAHLLDYVDYFGHVVSTYILNQFKGHWLLKNALNSSISTNLKFKDEIDFVTIDNLMQEGENVIYELSCLATNITKEVVQVLDFLFPF
jgi:hypothetical protein